MHQHSKQQLNKHTHWARNYKRVKKLVEGNIFFHGIFSIKVKILGIQKFFREIDTFYFTCFLAWSGELNKRYFVTIYYIEM